MVFLVTCFERAPFETKSNIDFTQSKLENRKHRTKQHIRQLPKLSLLYLFRNFEKPLYFRLWLSKLLFLKARTPGLLLSQLEGVPGCPGKSQKEGQQDQGEVQELDLP